MKSRLVLLALALATLASCAPERPEAPPVASRTKVFRAMLDPGTRTSLSMNDAGTHAEVIWNSGDEIVVYADSAGKRSYQRTFVTEAGGSREADFTCDDWDLPFSDVTATLAFYPASRFRVFSPAGDGLYRVSVVIPPVQTAVRGGLDPGLNISVAYSNDGSDALSFKNVLSLIHFTLEGPAASSVRKVVFKSDGTIAGDGAWIVSADGGSLSMTTRFNPIIYGSCGSVELEGLFENGGDYYIAVAPFTTAGFSMSFYDADGGIISKTSTKTLSLERSRIAEFGTITLDSVFDALPAGVERYMTQTVGSRPVVLAVTGDGFTADEQELFTTIARSAIDLIFDTEPYKTYKDWFTVYLMSAVSNESGGSVTDGKGNVTEAHDTAFETRWGTDEYGDMAANNDKVRTFVNERCPEVINGTLALAEVPILVLINDTRYGGICFNWSDGSCISLVPYVNGGRGSLLWNYPDLTASNDGDPTAGVRSTTDAEYEAMGGKYYDTSSVKGWFTSKGNWRNIVVHEFGGHGFGRLDDEYWYNAPTATDAAKNKLENYHAWTVPFCLNTTGNYDNPPWKEELLDNLDYLTEIDPRYGERIGRIQGASGYALGLWRSERISCMIDNRLYFSTWQRLLIVRRLMQKAGEAFTLEGFLAADNPADRLRDPAAGPAAARRGEGAYPSDEPAGPYIFCRPLPPPVLLER